jgi:hypothetical protein
MHEISKCPNILLFWITKWTNYIILKLNSNSIDSFLLTQLLNFYNLQTNWNVMFKKWYSSFETHDFCKLFIHIPLENHVIYFDVGFKEVY